MGEVLPFRDAGAIFYDRGCRALQALLATLQISARENVLLPSYLCGDVIRVFEAESVPVHYYPVDERCRFDLDEMAGRIDPGTRAIYLVHYFGFPQGLEAVVGLARDRGLDLIEDCAHSLLGRFKDRWLGEFGDAAIFSLRKTLPVPDGGALLINSKEIVPPPVPAFRRGAALQGIPKLLLKRLLWNLQFPPPLRADVGIVSEDFIWLGSDSAKEKGMSAVSLAILKKSDPTRIAAARRENFLYCLDRLSGTEGITPLYNELPGGAVPFSFPILTADRDRIRSSFAEQGIYMNAGFPEAPVTSTSRSGDEEEFAGSRFLARHLLELPVHEDLKEAHLEKIVKGLASIRGEGTQENSSRVGSSALQ